jgi:predicted ATP-binding protein involved in virulence
MRVHRLSVKNFKRFDRLALDLDPRFTLLVGDNGAGKTSVLDALAVAASIWLVVPPDRSLAGSRRSILPSEIRLAPVTVGDRTQFVERKPVVINAIGEIAGEPLEWTREIPKSGVRTSSKQAKQASDFIQEVFDIGAEGAGVLCPVLAYYGAGRAWLPSRARVEKGAPSGPARRWDAFYDCFEERIRIGDLVQWFQREAIAAGNRKGRWRPGFDAVRLAILRCVPEADALWFDGDRSDIVLSMGGQACPFSNLSAGQKMMVALIADIAIKAVTQNAYLLPEDELDTDGETLPDVLRRTPGLILIDELDTHLHPIWQRRVVGDLKDTFPAMQFVCTSHSPFVIQSLQPGELRTLDESGPVLVEYANQSIEDIAEDVQHVPVPQKSRRAQELARATARYFDLLEQAGDAASEDFRKAERDYRTAVERYSDNPGLSAFLKLQAMAAEKERKE